MGGVWWSAALDMIAGMVRCPTLIVADPADTMVPVTTAHALHERIPGSHLVSVPRGGHHLPRRTPEAVAEAITEFIVRLPT